MVFNVCDMLGKILKIHLVSCIHVYGYVIVNVIIIFKKVAIYTFYSLLLKKI